MKVREEIEKYAAEEDKVILHWLLDHYHWASQWKFVAFSHFEKYESEEWWQARRIWEPTKEGRIIYKELSKEKVVCDE